MLNVELNFTSSENTGTEFKIVLPKSNVQLSLYEEDSSKRLDVDFSRLSGSVIVVIDDDSSIREAMSMLLSKHSIIAVCGETNDEVLEELAKRQLEPDIIVADYRLREHLTGDTIITQLREAIEISTPGIIITGDSSPSRLNSLKESGFEILHKPVEADILFGKIVEVLSLIHISEPTRPY